MRAASRTTAGSWRVGTGALVAAGLLLLGAPMVALAHGDGVHEHAPTTPNNGAAATGGGAAPGTIPPVNEPVTGGGGAAAPANGAQPAAPNAGGGAPGALPPVVDPAAGKEATKTVPGTSSGSGSTDSSDAATTTTTTTVTDLIADPVTTLPATASGGGGIQGGGGIEDAGANVLPQGAVTAAGAGDLPFTGIEETILLISLAGMLVPIGVLLYCAARRGDLRRLHEHLSAPRFQWLDRPHA